MLDMTPEARVLRLLQVEPVRQWLKDQPTRKLYAYDNVDGPCMVTQYLQAHGIKVCGVGFNHVRLEPLGGEIVFPYEIAIIACPTKIGGPQCDYPTGRTFGQALKRAELCATKPA